MTAYDRVIDAFRSEGLTVIDNGHGKAQAQAPGHSPADRSVSITQIAGQVLMHSHSDPTANVLDTLGLTMADLFDDKRGTVYDYPDGRKVFRSVDKTFRQSGNTKGRNLFHVDRIGDAETVYYVEGEKDVLAAESVGAVAVCNAAGAGKSHLFDLTPLHGKRVVIVADKDGPGRKHAQQVAEQLDGKAEWYIVESVVGKDMADHVAAGKQLSELVAQRPPGRYLKVTRGSQVKTSVVDWLIEDWIPRGALTLLAGREGLGKSTIACEWSAWLTRQGFTIMYLHTEDSREHTVAPRLLAAGADMDKVLFVDVQTETSDTGTITLPLDNHQLEKVIEAEGVKFMVLDAATSSMSAELSGKDDRQVRQFLEPLSQMAARQNMVVLGLVHFGKRDGADSGKLILGSIAWSQVARSVLSVAYDEDDERLVVTNTKGNLAKRVRSEACRVVSKSVVTDTGATEVGVIDWLGETTQDARTILSGSGEDQSDRDDVDAWLTELLRAGRIKATEVYSAADAAGHSKDKAKNAKKRLGVIAVKDVAWWWSLPIQGSQGSKEGSHTQNETPLLPSRSEGVSDTPLDSVKGARESREQGSVHDSLDTPLPVEPSALVFDGTPPATRFATACTECGEALTAHNITGLCLECKLAQTVPPIGDVTENTPGMTPRVLEILARVNSKEAS
ncbi:Toprim domain-containing protein [Williamsia muralis]|uniref:Toprim domain-containing protein n=1 Tax=Williamsia marianensis TaxID=85044 RepID=A0A495K3A5_WILMA|nr:AAA family ATPase [Williamsia muralis]RKR94902.1 Toprim domain-containing protein [Williamsia muralis]